MDSNDTPAQGGERVAKVMSRAGLCSRREAEGWIKAGRVAVNGAILTSPALDVTPADRIEVDGKPLPERERTRLFLYHKPRGLVSTNADPEGRPTIFQALPQGLPRLISIGRLDLASEGLLLLTNDGALARALELPKTGWVRRYRARAHGSVEQRRLDKLRNGITVDGMRYGPIEASLDHGADGASNIWLTIAIREGKNREVRNVLGALDLATNRLIRTSFGPFELGDLPEGAIEEVTTRQLREALGPELAAQIGADFSGPLPERIARTEGTPPPRPSRRERFEEREREERPQRQQREARSDRNQRDARPERGERREFRDRDARGDRGERRERDERPDRGERRDHDAAPAEGEAPPKKRIGKHHGDTRVWRGGDKPLRRKFHGDRREQRNEDKPSGPKREGVVADRKGRTVVVERFGEPKAPPPERERKFRRPDRGEQRDERPRGKFGDDRPRGKFSGDRPLGKFGGDRPRGKFDGDRPHGKPGGGRSFGRRPPRRDRSGGPRPARPKT